VNAVFLDTSGWLASLDPRQAQHAESLEERLALVASDARFVTTHLVVAELHAMVTRDRGPRAGVRLLDEADTDPSYTVLYVDPALHAAAVDRWLRVFRDQPFSLCDAISFEVMRREGIREAFTLDHHFAVAGFTMLPTPRRAKKPRH
jgi:predicted nucleic acid-binding protein